MGQQGFRGHVSQGIVNLRSCSTLCWGDASFANMPDVNSQYGVLGMLVPSRRDTPDLKTRDVAGLPMFWKSASTKRKVRATMAAEAYGVSEATERGELLRMILTEVFQQAVPLRQIERKAELTRDLFIRTGSASLNSTVSRESGAVQDKCLFVVIAALREAFRQLRR